MIQTVEAEIDQEGNVRLKESVKLDQKRKALVIILDQSKDKSDPALLSESALSNDWNRTEEDDAWKAYQQKMSSNV
jgi:hypothetical protein